MKKGRERRTITSVVRCVPGCKTRPVCGGPHLGACHSRALREAATYDSNSDAKRARAGGKKQ